MLKSRAWGTQHRYSAAISNTKAFNPKDLEDPYLKFIPGEAREYEAKAQEVMSEGAEKGPTESNRTFYDWNGFFKHLKTFIR